MKTILNIILAIPDSFPYDKINEVPDVNSWVAVVAFIVFIMVIYIALSPGKHRHSKTVKTGKFNRKHIIFQ